LRSIGGPGYGRLAAGIAVDLSPKVLTQGKRTRVAFQSLKISRAGVACTLWWLAKLLDGSEQTSLLFFPSAEQEEQALNQAVVDVLVSRGATKAKWGYPERS
jgi:hypothetical protein